MELDGGIDESLHDLVGPWAESGSGLAAVVQVDGAAEEAIAALGRGDVVATEVQPAAAMARLAWAGASGGAHGRRRGAAVGRYNAWWAASHLAGLEWPPDDLGVALGELRWILWRPSAFTEGWELHLAVEDSRHATAWAVAATDVTEPDTTRLG